MSPLPSRCSAPMTSSTVRESTRVATRKLMRDEPLINFVGNVEGRDLTKGVVDVIVTDGFVGNVVLKLMEGLTEGLFQQLAHELQETNPSAMSQFKPAMKTIYAKHDWQEYGGALRVDGATRLRSIWMLLAIARRSVVTAVLAGFGRTISEVGAVLIVGGNIAGYTRIMTTAIVLKTSEGELGLALGLGLVLIGISIAVSASAFVLWER